MSIANATLYLFDATALRNAGERLDTIASPAPRSPGSWTRVSQCPAPWTACRPRP